MLKTSTSDFMRKYWACAVAFGFFDAALAAAEVDVDVDVDVVVWPRVLFGPIEAGAKGRRWRRSGPRKMASIHTRLEGPVGGFSYVRTVAPVYACGDWMRSEKESPSRLRSRARDLSMRRSLIVSLRVLSLRILVVRTEKSFSDLT